MSTIETFIIKKYQENKSTYEICEELAKEGVVGNFYPNKINRILQKAGVTLRSRSENQKINLDKGRSVHPTKGKQRSDKTKRKISDGVSDAYNDPAVRDERSRLSKAAWEKMGDEQKANLMSSAARAVRATSDEGSKIEKYLLAELRLAGYEVIFHSNSLIPNQSLQIDLFLPEIRTVVEIDGPSHFEPIWGEEALVRTHRADSEKNGLCLQYYNVVRMQVLAKKVTGAYCRKTLARLMPRLQYIKENVENAPKRLLPFEERLIFVMENK